MISVRSDNNAQTFVNIRIIARLFSWSLVFAALAATAANAETKTVKIMMDWIIQGTHAPFFVAQDKGYFKAQGVTVDTIDAGKGATNVAVIVAGGVYQFGWVDLPSMIRFNAANPASPLVAVYMSFDESPLAVITRKTAGIRKPIDLDGKKIAGGPGTAVHDTISILLKAANAENVKINWVAVQPQLFGPMLKRGEVDGTGGFTNSNIPAALELGMTLDDLFVIKYSDFGADMYGLALGHHEKFRRRKPANRARGGRRAQPGNQGHDRIPAKGPGGSQGARSDDEARHRESAPRHCARADQYRAREEERAQLGHAGEIAEDDRRDGDGLSASGPPRSGDRVHRPVPAPARRAHAAEGHELDRSPTLRPAKSRPFGRIVRGPASAAEDVAGDARCRGLRAADAAYALDSCACHASIRCKRSGGCPS